MAFSFLSETNLFDRYDDSKTYTLILTKPFPEFERIVRNLPHPSIDRRYPKTTDGTTASIVRKTPRRIIQQLPTGKVISDDDGWLGIIAGFIYTNKIIPKANEEYSLIQKGWSIVEKSLTFGATPTYTPFLNHDGDYLPDLTIPYWGDIFLQRGKKSGYDCSYIFMRSWWQKEDLEDLIDRETKLAKSAKKRGEKYDSSWDVPALKSILNAESAKDALALTPSERERMATTSGIELVVGFQKGVGGTFYTFNPTNKTIVRRKDNKDPRGKIPIDWMYGDIDGSNPWGRGIVELVGSLQNLIDADMQMYQFNRALMLAPPIIKKGNFNKKKIVYEPNAVIDIGNDATGSIEALKIDTSAVVNYPSLYGLQKSQLLNLTNSPDTSISSEIGNPGFSKTSAGVQQQQGNISVDDNYIRKMFETWFENWSETAINIYFAERSGIEELQLDKQTAMKLRELPNFDESMLSEDNKIRINYDTATPALKFKVDPSTTSIKDQAQQVQNATNLLDITMKYPQLNSNFGGPIDIDVLARRIVINSGIDDPEQIAPEPTEAQKQSKEMQKNQVNPFSPMFDKPSIRINYQDIPATAQLDLLHAAGASSVTLQDVLAGPVLDPNMRGVANPVDSPNTLLPGEQPGQAASSNPPIDLGDIYKQTTDPTVKAQIEQMAGLQPNFTHVQNQLETNAAQHVGDQINHLSNAANSLMPQPTQGQLPTQSPTSQNETPEQELSETPEQEAQEQEPAPQVSPHDEKIVAQLRALGFPDQIIQEAIELLNKGYSDDQVLQALQAVKGEQ